MKIAIIGTRGIPNHYGGFEQFAEYLSVGLVKLGHEIVVYNSHNHPYQKTDWNGVQIIHCHDPESKYGAIGQFVYDFNCILDTRKKDFDIILQLGYTSSSIWGWLLPRKKSIVTTNMDGLEWKRSKFSKPVQKFLKFAEKLAINNSDYLIADSVGIQQHIKTNYCKESVFIPYGANIFKSPDIACLDKYKIKKHQYNMLIARLEPENSIETILDGVELSQTKLPFLVIGNYQTKFGEYLKKKFKRIANIYFLGGIYDINTLNDLRYFSNIYFHGHTVGGTNPSLLEAMASNSLICANDNIFNKSILGEQAFYFTNSSHISEMILSVNKIDHINKLDLNCQKIANTYSWKVITEQYLNHFNKIYQKRSLRNVLV